MTFLDAKITCLNLVQNEAKLFEPRSEEENQVIFEILHGIFGADTEYWVGIQTDVEDPDGST